MANAAAEPDLGSIQIISPDRYVEHGYPHEAWSLLRRVAPLHWYENTAGRPFWAVSKHADIVRVSRQPELFANGPRLVLMDEPEHERGWAPPTLIEIDPPKHGAYRQVVSKRFTPRALRGMHDDIEGIALEILEALGAAGTEGECDFVEKVAAPLPIAVIAWLLGVPRDDWEQLFHWTNQTIGAGDPEYRLEGEDPQQTARRAHTEIFQYFAGLLEERKHEPRDDLVTFIAQARVDGEPLPTIDVLAFYNILVVAGNETTRNATSGGLLALAEHPEAFHALQKEPRLLGSGVEEILRWTSPIIHFARTATRDTELRGQRIREGDALALFYPSANRDEEVFPDPFAFRVDREPNRHLAFGVGEHFCLGAHVARLELQVIFRHLLRRLEWVELAGPVERLRSSLVGGVKHMPIRYRLKPS